MSNELERELTSRLKDAMRAKDRKALDVIRAIRSRVGEARTAKGFTGEVDDALYLTVITTYCKSMSKAREEYVKSGERGADHVAQLTFEIEYLSEFLPKKLDEAATIPLVEAAIASTGVTDIKMLGRVVGAVMKDHKDDVEPSVVKAIAARLLG